MSREWRAFLRDMIQHLDHVVAFTAGVTREEFLENVEKMLAVQRAFEIVGEASKQIPEPVRARHPHVDWRGVAGFRDVLSHSCFRVDPRIVWDLAANKAAPLREALSDVLSAEAGTGR